MPAGREMTSLIRADDMAAEMRGGDWTVVAAATACPELDAATAGERMKFIVDEERPSFGSSSSNDTTAGV